MKVRGESTFKPAIYFGAAISAVMALLPYVNTLFVPVYVFGPLAGVWFAARKTTAPISFTDGAGIGFLSAFYGAAAATALYDFVWQFYHEQLWRWPNAYRLLPLLAGQGDNAATPFEWYFLMLQLTIGAIVAGAIAAPAGILGARIFRRQISN